MWEHRKHKEIKNNEKENKRWEQGHLKANGK